MTKQAEYSRRHYEKNRSAIIADNKKRTQAIRGWVRELKAKTGCKYCGEKEPCCLDFHHRDTSQKEMTVAIAIQYGWSIARIKEEIRKCDVVCSNCHRKLHAGILLCR